MPPVPIPYARQEPYNNRDYVRAMADLMLKRGDVAAAAALQRGQNSQQMADRLGNITMATFAGIGQQRDEERDRAMRQATLDRQYELQQQERQDKAEERAIEQAYRRRQEERQAQQDRESAAKEFTEGTAVGTVVPRDEYGRTISGTGSRSAYAEQPGMAARLPAMPMIETAGIPSYSAEQGAEDFTIPARRTMSQDVAARPEGFRRVASQSEQVQLENLRRQAEAAQATAANAARDDQRAIDAAAALQRYQAAQLALSTRRTAATEAGARDQVFQGPDGPILIDRRTGQSRPVTDTSGQAVPKYSTSDGMAAYRTIFDRAVLNVAPNKRGPITALAQRLAAEGDTTQLLDVIKQAAIESEDVETKKQITGRMATLAALKDTKAILHEMQQKGVPTSFFRGTVEDLVRNIGKTTNPEYVALANRLQGTLINYRRAATGAGFSASEGAAYEKMFPTYKNELPVNTALIDGLQREMSTYDNSYWTYKLGPQGAQLLGYGGAGKPQVTRNPDGTLKLPR